ncbi:MAG TPA: hypothetical protein VJB41_01915 [Patescibacteria group bacterium]|nr:hypothetical protein [Patescibacteria group bacterium]
MNILEIIISTLISTGFIAALIHHHYDKKLKTHELKLNRYLPLIEELVKLVGNTPDYAKLLPVLNEALLFASNDTVKEILKFNKVFTEKRKKATEGKFQLSSDDIKPLLVSIRRDLDLKSSAIDEEGLTFFQKP